MPWCLTENNYIKTNYGFINVTCLEENNSIINKNFENKSIVKIGKRFLQKDERVLSFKVNSIPIRSEVTDLHKLYIVDGNEILKKPARDIKVGDYLYTPKPKLNGGQSINMVDYVLDEKWIIDDNRIVYSRDLNKSSGIYKHPKVDNDLYYLIGLYLAEGCVYFSNDCVSFSFNSNEKDTIVKKCKDSIKNVFGISENHIYYREYEDSCGIELIVKNALIGRFFRENFGTGASSKFVRPCWLLPVENEFRRELLVGYWDGDGHISYRHSNTNPECVVTTKSFDLCMCIRDVLLSLDIVPSITMNIRNDGRVSFITSVSSEIMDSILKIEGANRKPNSFYNYKINNGFAIRVTAIEEVSNYSGVIYSMSVEPDKDEDINGSYILNGIASSNSPWYRSNQLWAEPDVLDGARIMKHVYNNREEAKEKGLILREYIANNFSWKCIGEKIVKEIELL